MLTGDYYERNLREIEDEYAQLANGPLGAANVEKFKRFRQEAIDALDDSQYREFETDDWE